MANTNKKKRAKVIQIDINNWNTPEQLNIIWEWAAKGLSIVQIAENIGISTRTLYKWMDSDEKIMQTIKDGKSKADNNVENALYLHCIEDRDTKAIIFWLKNRQPDRWKDKIETDNQNHNEEIIKLEIE